MYAETTGLCLEILPSAFAHGSAEKCGREEISGGAVCLCLQYLRAAWMYLAATQYLLGIRPVWDGLLIDPCLPADWPEITVDRMFRGCRYHIVIRNMEKTVFLPHVEGRKEYFAEI